MRLTPKKKWLKTVFGKLSPKFVWIPIQLARLAAGFFLEKR